ncbi:DUF4097 domain-containing protein [Streptomyces sp. NPDC058373]|uniref:DUF4097 family beta strand repeat-containing protein n=1 Tax=Streptomyces sp. NPDC058373 TaxID=3346465 RepID=UPI0036547D5E
MRQAEEVSTMSESPHLSSPVPGAAEPSQGADGGTGDGTWSVDAPRRMSFEGPLTTLRIRVVNGAVNVVGSPDPTTHLDISELSGRPLTVRREGETLTVEYEEFSWQGLRRLIERGKLPDARTLDHRAVVSVAVPESARLDVRAVGADTVVSNVAGFTDVKAVSGETTLVGLSGPVRADTVTGRVEAQSVTGALTVAAVSGDLTVVDGTSPTLRADSVNGDMIVDVDQADSPADIELSSVSGEIAVRLPHPADARVEANTTSGSLSHAFEDLRVTGQFGMKKITGKLGAGSGRLKASTVSGSIALLRRPPSEGPTSTTPADPAGPNDKKVL